MDKLKNIVVLRDLPSNLIDEALLILKPNHKIKSVEHIQKRNDKPANNNSQDYIIKEAEMVISSFLSRNDISNNKKVKKLEQKYKRLKITSAVLSLIIFAGIIINFL